MIQSISLKNTVRLFHSIKDLFHSSYIRIKKRCLTISMIIVSQLSWPVDSLVNLYLLVLTYFGTLFSILKRRFRCLRIRAQRREKCSGVLHLCSKMYRSFYNLDLKRSIKDLWNSVIIPVLSLLLLPVALFVACQLIFCILMSLLLLNGLQNFIPRHIQLFQLVETLKSSLHQQLTALVTNF